MFHLRPYFLALIATGINAAPAEAQTAPKRATNVDEGRVGSYTLPDPLRLSDGRRVADATRWTKERRPEVLALFAAHQFGSTPATPLRPRVEIAESGAPGLGGLAKRSQIRLVFGNGPDAPVVRILLYVPTNASGRVPVLLHLGFSPNVLIVDEPGIEEGFGWNAKTRQRVPGRQATLLAGFDPKVFVARGHAVAHVYYGDIEPDVDGGEAFGVRSLMGKREGPRAPGEWGAIGAWAWGLSRVADYLQSDAQIDPAKIALSGASRLGKTALWAAAQDERFTLVMPIISGEGGAALSRRDFGETIADITSPTRYHYWWAPRYASYGPDPSRLPIDAHMLLALIAPRPMLLVNGDTDTWSDWEGERLAAEAARPVYDLFGRGSSLQIVTHKGGHVLLPSDLVAMADFMDREFGRPGIVAANRARAANPNRPTAWWAEVRTRPEGWFAGPEARTMADNILSWQDPQAGGWPLMNTVREPNRGDPAQAGPWGSRAALIAATVNEMRFLVRAQRARHDPRYLPAIERGLGFILAAQYPHGGWPHSWPIFANPYDRQATLNDDEMVDLMTLLREVATAPEFRILAPKHRRAAQAGFERGVDFLLRTQILSGGVPTGWAQQYDEKTLEPRPARAFEPVAISGNESAGVLMLLMSIDRPSPAVVRAIEAGVAWYRRSQIDGVRVVLADGDRVVRPDPAAPPIWARFYQIGTNRPILAGRDGVIRYSLADVERERRAGYGWYGAWGTPVLERHAVWRASHSSRRTRRG
jgi:PelA/Pel-15E family pectate lyase